MNINDFILDNVPRVIAYKVISWKRLFSSKRVKKEVENLKELRSKRRFDQCFIVGTGPSIQDVEFSNFKKSDIFLTGESFIHSGLSKLNGLFYIAGGNHPPFNEDYIDKLSLSLEGLPSDTKYIFSHTNYKYSFANYFFGDCTRLSSREKYLINYTGSSDLNKYSKNDCKVYDITKNPFNPRTVILTALQVALYMGYKNIYLVGCEHDYIKRYFESGFVNHHFYSDNESNIDHKEYLDNFSLFDWFEEYHKRWTAYKHVDNYFRSNGVNIINCTPDSVLDIFPKTDLSNVEK